MMGCTLCPRACGADRSKGLGRCGVGEVIKLARAAPHFWEEPCISGERGSGAVFFSGCPLGCVYCQNSEILSGLSGREITPRRLSEIFLELCAQGVHNINLVTPCHFAPGVVEAIEIARSEGLSIPIVCNTGGYESIEILGLFKGHADIYLPDYKYRSAELADRYSSARDYPQTAEKALREMFSQVGSPEFGEDGMMVRGMIVRHLVLPGCAEDSKAVIRFLHETFGEDIFISIMNQYTPSPRAAGIDRLGGALSAEEYAEVVDFALSIGVENGFIQEEGTVGESFIPPFDNTGV